jgi:hypothetical protein
MLGQQPPETGLRIAAGIRPAPLIHPMRQPGHQQCLGAAEMFVNGAGGNASRRRDPAYRRTFWTLRDQHRRRRLHQSIAGLLTMARAVFHLLWFTLCEVSLRRFGYVHLLSLRPLIDRLRLGVYSIRYKKDVAILSLQQKIDK